MRLAALLLLAAVSAPAGSQTVRLTIPLDGSLRAERLGPRELAEVGAVVLTGVGHLVASQAGASDVFIPVAVAGWGGYVGARALTELGFLGELGLTGGDLGRAARDVALLSAGAGLGMAAYGAANGSLRLDRTLVPLLVLYPVWGITQQTLVQGFLTRHLDAAGLPVSAVVPVSAAAFGVVHVPNWPLTAATTAMGGAFAPLYLRDGAVVPLGVAHGVLGALFYVWVLDRDPYGEIFRGECPRTADTCEARRQ